MTIELRFWQVVAASTGAALSWRDRLRRLQPYLVFLGGGAATFLLGRVAGRLLLALFD